MFSELTTELAALTARRGQIEANVRTHRDRIARFDEEIAKLEAEAARLAQATGSLGDLAALAAATETAVQTLAQAEAQPRPPRRTMSPRGRRWKPRARR